MELETTFYIVSLVYMGLMFVLFVALLIAVLVIKAKINRLHRMVDDKVAAAQSLVGKVAIGISTIRHFVKR